MNRTLHPAPLPLPPIAECARGWMDASWSWWLNGVDVSKPRKVVSGGGNWWPSDTWTDYFHDEVDGAKTMEAIDDWLHAGYGVGIFVAGHCITIWGFNYDPSVDKSAEPENYSLGIWMTDSDSHKGNVNANDVLEYFEVEWNSDDNEWYTPNLGGGMIIRRVQALEPYPSGRPDADAGGSYTVDEGTAVIFDGSGSSDNEGGTLHYRWDYDYSDTWNTRDRESPSWDTTWSTTATTSHTWNDDYSGEVLLQVNANHSLDIDKTSITVNNVNPTVDAGIDTTIDEGDTLSRPGSFTDPGADTWTATVDFGDGTGVQPLALTGKTFTLNHAYGDDGVYTVTISVTDDDGGVGTDTVTFTVLNVAPIVDVGADATVDEGDTLSRPGSFTDPGADTWTATVDFGDGTGVQPLTLTGKTFDLSHIYGDNGLYTVIVKVTDDEGAYGEDIAKVTVNNVAPSIGSFGSFTVDEGAPLTLNAPATDPGSDDLAFVWQFELGPTALKTFYNNEVGDDPYPSPLGTYPFLVTDVFVHTYGDNGVYTLTLTVTDDDGGETIVTTTITVNNVAPMLSSIMISPPNPNNPEFILPIVHEPGFTGSAADPGSDDLTCTWNWGDSSEDTIIYYNDGMSADLHPSPWGAFPFSSSDTIGHTYSMPGTYTVTLTVEDDDGGIITTSEQITILSPEEAGQAINDYLQCLSDSAFDKKPEKSKKVFDNMFSAINDMLVNLEYKGTIVDLSNNVRAKTDGLVDGTIKNDWVIDQTTQEEVCWKIDAFIAYLETLL